MDPCKLLLTFDERMFYYEGSQNERRMQMDPKDELAALLERADLKQLQVILAFVRALLG